MKTGFSIKYFFPLMCLAVLINSCLEQDPNLNEQGQDEFKFREMEGKIDTKDINYTDTVYVPIYSNIYIDKMTQNSLMSATLSVRNTNYKDSLYISKVAYYNTEGELVKNYVDHPIIINPMATLNYVVEKEDDSGGAGANFIVVLSSKNESTQPLIQAIMVGENGNKGFSFVTEGKSISKN